MISPYNTHKKSEKFLISSHLLCRFSDAPEDLRGNACSLCIRRERVSGWEEKLFTARRKSLHDTCAAGHSRRLLKVQCSLLGGTRQAGLLPLEEPCSLCVITPGSLLGATAHLLTAPVLPINIFMTLACLPSRNLQGLSGSRKAIMGTVNFYACPL